MDLTPHQKEKHDEIISLLRKGEKRIVLAGSAGCGKTVLASELVKTLKKDYTINPAYNNGAVFVTAPTNKALSVLQGKIDTRVEFKTIHSACRLKRVVDKYSGIEKYIRSKGFSRDDLFPKCRITLIDECSMLSSEFIGGTEWQHQIGEKGYLDSYGFPIIFIGDNKQLNPVGEAFSPVFHQNYPTVELTEIIRQGAGNPIIDLSRDIDMLFFRQPRVTSDGKGYIYHDIKEQLIEDLAEVNGTDEMKYLAYINDEVDDMNRMVRERIYGENPAKLELGETIVFNKPLGEFYTNKELKVESLEVIVNNIKIPKYNTKFDSENCPIGEVDEVRMKVYKVNEKINIIHEDSDRMFKIIADSLKHQSGKHGWDWRGYYWFIERFGDIKYNHAITVHKSQGSTYKTTIMNISDIMKNRNAEERTRMLYTGITRASDLLILNKV